MKLSMRILAVALALPFITIFATGCGGGADEKLEAQEDRISALEQQFEQELASLQASVELPGGASFSVAAEMGAGENNASGEGFAGEPTPGMEPADTNFAEFDGENQMPNDNSGGEMSTIDPPEGQRRPKTNVAIM